jgi:hypothetical protein
MPTSASPKRNPKPPAPNRGYIRPLILLGVVAVLLVIVITLPASLVRRILPPALQADQFSGSLWHGSAGKVLVDSREVGAIEWHARPWSLLTLTLSADVLWVKVGFVAQGRIDVDRHGATAHDVVGGGPIEDLHSLGMASGWRGTTQFKFSILEVGFDGVLKSAVGELGVTDLSSPQIAEGGTLGGYKLDLRKDAISPDAELTAELADSGGPLELKATIHYSVKTHIGLLSGTLKERPQASEALREQLQNLSQMHARDAEGRIPVELEFTL